MIALFDEFPAGAHPTKDQYEHFSIGRADERTARRAQAARASTNDDGQTVADTADMDEEEYNDADVELPHQERIGHDVATVHISTVAFHQKILQELDDGQDEPGGRPPYHEWQSMWVEPPDPMVVVPFSEAAWHVQPICSSRSDRLLRPDWNGERSPLCPRRLAARSICASTKRRQVSKTAPFEGTRGRLWTVDCRYAVQ